VDNPLAAADPLGLTSPCNAATRGIKRKTPDGDADPVAAAATGATVLGSLAKKFKSALPSRSKYPPGSHGRKTQEQKRLNEKFGKKVSGSTHESEHPISFDLLGGERVTGIKRGTAKKDGGAISKEAENTAPAYQEIEKLHADHAGTGKSHAAEAYKVDQGRLLKDGNIGSAVQYNQLHYAHLKGADYQGLRSTPDGRIEARQADDSFREMIEGTGTFPRFERDAGGALQRVDVPSMTPTDRAAAFLSREALNTKSYPSPERQAEIQRYFINKGDGLPTGAPPTIKNFPDPPSPAPGSPMDLS
jgi:hypothetical protein